MITKKQRRIFGILKVSFVVDITASRKLLDGAMGKRTVVVVGSGAVGLSYGCRLLEAEHISTECDTCTHFICRRDYDHCISNGIWMTSPDGDFYSGNDASFRSRIHKNSTTIEIPAGGVDWIVCAVKSYSLQDDASDSLRSLMTPMVGERTRFLLIMNGLGCQEKLLAWFGKKSIFVGMAFTCANRNDPSRSDAVCSENFVLVNHIAFGALHIGHCQDDAEELQVALNLWSHTKIASKVTIASSLLRAQWSKLCWNIPFSGLCVALGGVTTDIIAKDPDLRFLADQIIKDTVSLANEDMRLNNTATTLPDFLDVDLVRQHCWSLTDGMGPYKPSTVLDLIGGKDIELEYIFLMPLRRAREITRGRKQQLCGDSAATESDSAMSDWSHVETVVLQLCAIARIAVMKRESQVPWTPTYVMDDK